MAMLTDLDKAKIHLRVDGDELNQLVSEKLEQASSIVLDYLKLDAAPDPVPDFVQAATLLSMEALFVGSDPLSDVVKRLLHRYRDPAMA